MVLLMGYNFRPSFADDSVLPMKICLETFLPFSYTKTKRFVMKTRMKKLKRAGSSRETESIKKIFKYSF